MAKYDQGGGCACGLYKECCCSGSNVMAAAKRAALRPTRTELLAKLDKLLALVLDAARHIEVFGQVESIGKPETLRKAALEAHNKQLVNKLTRDAVAIIIFDVMASHGDIDGSESDWIHYREMLEDAGNEIITKFNLIEGYKDERSTATRETGRKVLRNNRKGKGRKRSPRR